jgi:hypothetical protein
LLSQPAVCEQGWAPVQRERPDTRTKVIAERRPAYAAEQNARKRLALLFHREIL